MMDDELIEKVARAICFERVGRISDCIYGCTSDTGCLGTFKPDEPEPRYARAAIQAMKDAGWKSPDEVDKLETAARDEGYASGFPD